VATICTRALRPGTTLGDIQTVVDDLQKNHGLIVSVADAATGRLAVKFPPGSMLLGAAKDASDVLVEVTVTSRSRE
jgi:hypothetical protein